MREHTCDDPIVIGSEVVQITIVPYYWEGREYHLPGDEGFFVEDITDVVEPHPYNNEKAIKLKGYPGWFPMSWFRVWAGL
jgi:hypothetical protein